MYTRFKDEFMQDATNNDSFSTTYTILILTLLISNRKSRLVGSLFVQYLIVVLFLLLFIPYWNNGSISINKIFISKLALYELEFKTNAINKQSLPWQQIPNLSETIDLPFLLVKVFIIHMVLCCIKVFGWLILLPYSFVKNII